MRSSPSMASRWGPAAPRPCVAALRARAAADHVGPLPPQCFNVALSAPLSEKEAGTLAW
jgi:hypothetical protein